MTPLLTALSSCLDACRKAVLALSLSPASAASRKERTAVFTEPLTLLLGSRAASLVRIRLIWDLMFATKLPQMPIVEPNESTDGSGAGCRTTSPDYQCARPAPKSAPHGCPAAGSVERRPARSKGASGR